MKLEQLKYFKTVVEEKSIHKAAEVLYVSQPNVSRAISSMEEELNEQLLIRNNRGVTLTKLGESLYFYAKSINEQMDSIQQLSQLNQYKLISHLKVSVAKLFLQDDLMFNYYKQFNNEKKQITLLETNTEEVLQNVSTLKSEIGIVVINTHQYTVFHKILELYNLEMVEVARSPVYVHVNSKSSLKDYDTIQMKDLLHHTILGLPADYFENINLTRTFGGVHISDFKSSLLTNNYHAIIHMMKQVNTFMFGHKWQIRELEKSGILSIPVNDADTEMILVWLKRKKEILSEEAEFLIHRIGEYSAM